MWYHLTAVLFLAARFLNRMLRFVVKQSRLKIARRESDTGTLQENWLIMYELRQFVHLSLRFDQSYLIRICHGKQMSWALATERGRFVCCYCYAWLRLSTERLLWYFVFVLWFCWLWPQILCMCLGRLCVGPRDMRLRLRIKHRSLIADRVIILVWILSFNHVTADLRSEHNLDFVNASLFYYSCDCDPNILFVVNKLSAKHVTFDIVI